MQLGDGSVVDITDRLQLNQGGTFSQSINPITLDTDLTISSLVVNNADGYFSPLVAGSIGENYAGARIRLLLGWVLDDGTEIPETEMFVGFLEEIFWRVPSTTAELLVSDIIDELKLSSVPEPKVDEVQPDRAPASNILTFLGAGYIGIPAAYIHYASFTDNATIESGASQIMRSYKLLSDNWWRHITECLRHGHAYLRVNRSGQIEYRPVEPSAAAGSLTITEGDPYLQSFAGSEQFRPVRNSARVFRGDGNPVPAAVETALSPIEFQTPGGVFDRRRPDDDYLYLSFNQDSPAQLSADRALEIKTEPLGSYDCELALHPDTYLVEVGDRVNFTLPSLGWDARPLEVTERQVRIMEGKIELRLFDTAIEDQPWLILNKSGHKLDDGKLLY